MKALVCGGRDYTRSWHVHYALDKLHAIYHFTELAHGDAPGVDTFAGEWAWCNYVEVHAYPANWLRFQRRAGHVRNVKMMVEFRPDIGIVFPGGDGTADMRKLLVKDGYKIIDIEPFNMDDLL